MRRGAVRPRSTAFAQTKFDNSERWYDQVVTRFGEEAGGSATLKCQLGNQPALGFYRHLGWTEIVAGTNEFGAWVTLRSPR